MNVRFGLRGRLTRLLRASFPWWERLGVHVLPVHYYSPVPDTRTLRPDTWVKRSALVGIDLRDEEQLALLNALAAEYQEELRESFSRGTGNNSLLAPSFGPVDAHILYGLVRHLKPRRIIEIGSGASTRIEARAALRNAEEGHPCELVAIEPYPEQALRAGFPGLSRLIQQQAQEVNLGLFESLSENDILFIDSSHVAKIGSDVVYELLEVVPRLPKGVVVHVHDIFFPLDYPRNQVLDDQRFWNEQYVLQAFLAFNPRVQVLWAGTYMHLTHPDSLERAFPSYRPSENLPGSFWFKMVS